MYKGPELLEKISEQRSKREPIDNQYDSLLLKYSVTHPNSIISLALLVDDFRSYNNIIDSAFNELSINLKKSTLGKYFMKKINSSKLIEPGQKFPQIQVYNILNKKLLSYPFNFKSQYTLIDFWFGKCGACIRQFPQYNKLVTAYSSEQFSMVSIASDYVADIENTKAIIKKNKLSWIQYWDKDMAQANRLNIGNFPTNFLLDKNGIIVAKNIEPTSVKKFLDIHIK